MDRHQTERGGWGGGGGATGLPGESPRQHARKSIPHSIGGDKSPCQPRIEPSPSNIGDNFPRSELAGSNPLKYWAGFHDNIPADLLPMWQNVRRSRATQPRCTEVPDWVTTSAEQPTFWDSDSFNCQCHGRQLAPNRCSLGEGSVWDVVVQRSPGCRL